MTKEIQMDDNIHTSVVIELASQEEIEDRKTYKIDFNEEEAAKDYVIDQIFCGENITVYALFEVPEVENDREDGEITEISNPVNRNDEYRFIHKNSFKKNIQEKKNGYLKQISVNSSEDEMNFLSNIGNQNQSYHCLKHLSENYDIPTGDESEMELKVLFKSNLISKVPKQTKFKAVSKGVNTEIAQSPKLIEEVQKAVTLNFLYGKNDEKLMEMTSIPSGNPSYEITDAETRQSFSSFSTDMEIKRTSPDFLFVPLLMMEDRTMSSIRREKRQALSKERSLVAKTGITSTKVSLGTNTDVSKLSYTTFENEEKRELESCYSSQCEGSQTVQSETMERKNKKSSTQSHLNKKDKDSILNEIKKLQSKLNALIKSIEYNDVYLSTNEDEDVVEVEKAASKEVTEKLKKTLEPANREQEQYHHRIHNKFDDIPIFSPLTFPKKNPRFSTRKTALNVSKTKVDVAKSLSTDFIPQKEKVTTVFNVIEKRDTKPELKNIYSGINFNWDLKENWKSVGVSKSDANNRVFFVPKLNCVKKSLSFDLRDDKMEMFCLKKLKNSSFKFEGGAKMNIRIIQNGEVHLGDNIAPIAGEMGDEANKKLRLSKTTLNAINQNPEKDEMVCLKNARQEMQKIQNEEEGDAKCLIPNQSIISQNNQPNSVLYCSSNTIVSDELIKSVKNIEKVKFNLVKMDDAGTKISSDSEKPTTSNKAQRKSSATESELKREVKTVKKLNIKNRIVEKKIDKKEAVSNDFSKPKLVSGCRKLPMKSTAESKLHIDKLIKRTGESELKLDNVPVTTNHKIVTRATVEKQGGKTSDKSRPHSQKRDLQETIIEVREKEVNKKISSNKKLEKEQSEPEVTKNVDAVCATVPENKPEAFPENDAMENSAWLSTNPSSVVVELFSKKPTSVDEFYTEVSQEPTEFLNVKTEKENNTDAVCGREDSKNDEKPIVKSVWALTKVLLFEDGTKKLEILEASLTPPGYFLKPKDQI